MKTGSKQTALICPNGIVKFYNTNGTRNEQHPNGLYNIKDLDFYNKNYIVIFSN